MFHHSKLKTSKDQTSKCWRKFCDLCHVLSLLWNLLSFLSPAVCLKNSQELFTETSMSCNSMPTELPQQTTAVTGRFLMISGLRGWRDFQWRWYCFNMNKKWVNTCKAIGYYHLNLSSHGPRVCFSEPFLKVKHQLPDSFAIFLSCFGQGPCSPWWRAVNWHPHEGKPDLCNTIRELAIWENSASLVL